MFEFKIKSLKIKSVFTTLPTANEVSMFLYLILIISYVSPNGFSKINLDKSLTGITLPLTFIIPFMKLGKERKFL